MTELNPLNFWPNEALAVNVHIDPITGSLNSHDQRYNEGQDNFNGASRDQIIANGEFGDQRLESVYHHLYRVEEPSNDELSDAIPHTADLPRSFALRNMTRVITEQLSGQGGFRLNRLHHELESHADDTQLVTDIYSESRDATIVLGNRSAVRVFSDCDAVTFITPFEIQHFHDAHNDEHSPFSPPPAPTSTQTPPSPNSEHRSPVATQASRSLSEELESLDFTDFNQGILSAMIDRHYALKDAFRVHIDVGR